MTRVSVNGSFDSALKKWKQRVARSGVPSEVRKRDFYVKPGIRRAEKKRAAIKNARKKNRQDY